MYFYKNKILRFSFHLFSLSIIISFFSFNILTGDRSFFNNKSLDFEIDLANEKLSLLKKNNIYLLHKTNLLKSSSIDPDIISEYAKKNLGLYNKNEIIILFDN